MNASRDTGSLQQVISDVQQLSKPEREKLRRWLNDLVEQEKNREKIKMRDRDTILIRVKDGKVIHHTWNMSLPHVEFVRRAAGELPERAWVGTASKLDGEGAAITSKHFFGYQLPAPAEVLETVRNTFE